jgi:hypothetical protein
MSSMFYNLAHTLECVCGRFTQPKSRSGLNEDNVSGVRLTFFVNRVRIRSKETIGSDKYQQPFASSSALSTLQQLRSAVGLGQPDGAELGS